MAKKLTGNQKKLDVNNNGMIDAKDLRMLRTGATPAILQLSGETSQVPKLKDKIKRKHGSKAVKTKTNKK